MWPGFAGGIPAPITHHLHYTVGTAPSDATYARSERFNAADKAEYERRAGESERLATQVRAETEAA